MGTLLELSKWGVHAVTKGALTQGEFFFAVLSMRVRMGELFLTWGVFPSFVLILIG